MNANASAGRWSSISAEKYSPEMQSKQAHPGSMRASVSRQWDKLLSRFRKSPDLMRPDWSG
jgi:hypothetical protein